MVEVQQPFAPIPDRSTKSADDAAAGEETVLMDFPRAVLLTMPDLSRILFTAGVQKVPKSIADHQYLKDSGAKPIREKKPEPLPEISDRHVRFLQSRGYRVKTVADAQKFVENLGPKMAEGFFADAAEWQEPAKGQKPPESQKPPAAADDDDKENPKE